MTSYPSLRCEAVEAAAVDGALRGASPRGRQGAGRRPGRAPARPPRHRPAGPRAAGWHGARRAGSADRGLRPQHRVEEAGHGPGAVLRRQVGPAGHLTADEAGAGREIYLVRGQRCPFAGSRQPAWVRRMTQQHRPATRTPSGPRRAAAQPRPEARRGGSKARHRTTCDAPAERHTALEIPVLAASFAYRDRRSSRSARHEPRGGAPYTRGTRAGGSFPASPPCVHSAVTAGGLRGGSCRQHCRA